MQHLLDITRKNFDDARSRNFSWLDRTFYLSIPKPVWCDESDKLFAAFQSQKNLFSNGVVVWAHIIQANVLLFEPGRDDCPASVIFSPDCRAQVDLEKLGEIAHSLFELKGTEPGDAGLSELTDNITDEMTRTFGLKIPSSVSPNLDLFEASTFVTRKHLPNRMLSVPFFPLLVAAKPPYYNFPVPSKFWPKQLIDFWITNGQQ